VVLHKMDPPLGPRNFFDLGQTQVKIVKKMCVTVAQKEHY